MHVHTCTNTHVSGHLFKWALIRTASTYLCLLSHDWWNNTSIITVYCFRNNCPVSVDPYHPRGCSVVFTCGVLTWYLSMPVDPYHSWDWPMVFRKGNRLLWHLCSQLWLNVDLVFYKCTLKLSQCWVQSLTSSVLYLVFFDRYLFCLCKGYRSTFQSCSELSDVILQKRIFCDVYNDCGAIEFDIASELYSLERFGHVDLCQLRDQKVQSNN